MTERSDRKLIQLDNRRITSSPPVNHQNPLIAAAASPTDVSHLAKAIQESIAMNRLPMPMPTVISGDPILYIEWKASFISLVDLGYCFI
jgi:hypothetical protein